MQTHEERPRVEIPGISDASSGGAWKVVAVLVLTAGLIVGGFAVRDYRAREHERLVKEVAMQIATGVVRQRP